MTVFGRTCRRTGLMGRTSYLALDLFGKIADNFAMKKGQRIPQKPGKAELDKIQSNLSYSYLHAVVSRAGGACDSPGQTADGMGMDAVLNFVGQFSPKPTFRKISITVQLKSTRQTLRLINGRFSYAVKSEQYRKYTELSPTEFLLVLFVLPDDPGEWLKLTPQELTLKKCCYWTSLNEAPPWSGSDVTVHIPEKNLFNVEQLHQILAKLSIGERLKYES